MSAKPQNLRLRRPWLLLLLFRLFHLSAADLGTAARYRQPFTPTACYGNDQSQFPTSGMFAAASEGIWDNGAACGRQYLIKCISSALPRACVAGQTIQVKIVDRAKTMVSRPSHEGTTIVLSDTAFAAISNPDASSLNIELLQL